MTYVEEIVGESDEGSRVVVDLLEELELPHRHRDGVGVSTAFGDDGADRAYDNRSMKDVGRPRRP